MTLVGAWEGPHALCHLCGATVHDKRQTGLHQFQMMCSGRRGRGAESYPVLVLVHVVNQIGLGVVPANADVAGLEYFAQLVADEVNDRLEVELGSHALLDTVDDAELVGALFQQGVGCLQFPGALRHLLLEALRPLRVVQRDGGLTR